MIKIIIGALVALATFLFVTTEENRGTDPIEDTPTVDITVIDTTVIENRHQEKPLPQPTYTVTNSDELYSILLNSVNGDIVYIPNNIKLDLTNTLNKIKNKYPPRFEIPEGVTLMSDGARFGQGGAMLFVTDDVKDEVFRINSGAQIIGLRFRGPQKDCNLLGIQAYVSPGDTIIIENCELWGWNEAAIRNRGDLSQSAPKNNMIIRNNYIHDNYFGSGYGIATSFSTFTLAEYNKFKNNRHDISASGKYGCDYTFRYNTNILQWTNQSVNRKSHSVDVHGWPFNANIKPQDRQRNREAGSRIEIYGNHFKDAGDNEVIHIRGIPEFYVKIYDNKFASTNVTPIEQKYIDVSGSENKLEIKNNNFKVKF